MLQTIQKYYRSIVGFVFIFMILVSMLVFGVDLGGGRQGDSYAIKVNDEEVPLREFYQRKREVEGRLRQQLGENYAQFAPQILGNINQNVTEDLLTETLFIQFAKENDFTVGADQVQKELFQLFPAGQFNVDQYRYFLQQVGMSAQTFEKRLANEALRQQVTDILQDASQASDAEALALLKEEKTNYDLSYVRIVANAYKKDVKVPSDEILHELYDENATSYEQPAKVAYTYAVLKPEENLDIVEILPEDVELYYTENIRNYTDPERIFVRQIEFTLPKEGDKEAVKKEAEAVLKQLEDGTSFKELAAKHNTDKELKKKSGELGWKKRGELPQALEAKAFEIKEAGGNTDIIESGTSLIILGVENYEPATPKEFEAVKAEIEKEIRTREAPAFVAAKAQELYEQWLNQDIELDAFAKAEKIAIQKTQGLLDAKSDPNLLTGLTRKVITLPDQTKQLIDIGKNSVLVQVTNYEESHIAPFEAVKDKVIAMYKENEAQKLAREKAQSLYATLHENAAITDAAKKEGLTVKEEKEITQKNLSKVPFLRSSGDAQVLLSGAKGKVLGKEPFRSGNDFFVAVVNKITVPDEKTLQEDLEKTKEAANQQLALVLQQSFRNNLKAGAEIDINQAVFAE